MLLREKKFCLFEFFSLLVHEFTTFNELNTKIKLKSFNFNYMKAK